MRLAKASDALSALAHPAPGAPNAPKSAAVRSLVRTFAAGGRSRPPPPRGAFDADAAAPTRPFGQPFQAPPRKKSRDRFGNFQKIPCCLRSSQTRRSGSGDRRWRRDRRAWCARPARRHAMNVVLKGVCAKHKKRASGSVATYFYHRATGARVPGRPGDVTFHAKLHALNPWGGALRAGSLAQMCLMCAGAACLRGDGSRATGSRPAICEAGG